MNKLELNDVISEIYNRLTELELQHFLHPTEESRIALDNLNKSLKEKVEQFEQEIEKEFMKFFVNNFKK